MTSQEVLIIAGEAKAKPVGVLAQLESKRAELAAAEAELARAEAAMDTDATIAATQRVDVLRRFIGRLEQDSSVWLQGEGERRARAWLRKATKELATVAAEIGKAQAVIRDKRDELIAAMEVEARLRRRVDDFDIADQVLSARFGLSRSPVRAALPDVIDYAGPVLKVLDKMLPSRQGMRRLIVPLIASDSEEVRRRKRAVAAAAFVEKYPKEVPAEVSDIVAEAPLPAEIQAPAPSQRDHDAVIGMGASAVRALNAIPGPSGVSGI